MKRNGEPDSIPLQFFSQVDWDVCPSDLPCCNEYGYCRSRVCRWLLALFEDLSQTWQVVDHLELESKQPLHAAWNTIYVHYTLFRSVGAVVGVVLIAS